MKEKAPCNDGAPVRDVVLADYVVSMLREYRIRQLAAGEAGPDDRVFRISSASMYQAFKKIRSRAGLGSEVTWHTMRHTFASLGIRARVDTVFLSRQLGHSSPDITLRVYTHECDQMSHADETRDALQAQIGRILAETREDDGAEERAAGGDQIAD
jgi:integrase